MVTLYCYDGERVEIQQADSYLDVWATAWAWIKDNPTGSVYYCSRRLTREPKWVVYIAPGISEITPIAFEDLPAPVKALTLIHPDSQE